ncbi:DegV family protein [Oceanirhabdus sp. W0125-5]|uniref:DegV family protein n=1 Tax=Oceanirhabdus sp. W0125-5 TaxID=2999116 RepID=UPI0022F3331B|nr:DegV family protein [Oceanirhabdus sp. W0125-5]WBW96750.1 DegV family protein [Oceanirhabdus sp. W0125-5]
MSKIKIFSDSTCDLTKEIIDKNNISIIPLYINFDNDVYKDLIEITTDELYKQVEVRNKLPKTAAASPNDFYNAFKPHIDNGENIIYIGISSKISSTINNAMLAAQEFPEGRIEIIDSLNLSSGIGLLVMKAVDYVNEGMDFNQVTKKIKQLVPKVRTAFVIDTLDYLYKGGRCSAVQHVASGILGIKPIISVIDGKMIVAKKIRGKRIKVMNSLLSYVFKDKSNIDLSRVTITHSKADENAIYLKEKIENDSEIDIKELLITNAGCIISSHCGKNTIGILYIEK